MKKILTTLWLLLLTVGVVFPNFYESLFDRFQFGAVSYPTSLDVFENPSATQSVATVVTHSTQHGNANDALEAIEAKLGIGASTPIVNTIFMGSGAGSSVWSSYATATNMTLSGIITSSGLGTFGSLISQASSTIVGGLTITGNSTSTNATSTIGAFTSFATSTKYFGGGLNSCSGGSFLTWTTGNFGCSSPAAGGTTAGLATTTDTTIPFIGGISMGVGDVIIIWTNCSQSNNGCTGQVDIKPQNHFATTTLWVGGVASGKDYATGFGVFTATTTILLDISNGTASDQGGQVLYMLINN